MGEPAAGAPPARQALAMKDPAGRAPARRRGIDRLTVALLALAAFLLVLAFLGTQLGASARTAARPREIVLRRVYRTTVVERIFPAGAGGPAGGTSVSQSVSGSAAAPAAAPLVARSSG